VGRILGWGCGVWGAVTPPPPAMPPTLRPPPPPPLHSSPLAPTAPNPPPQATESLNQRIHVIAPKRTDTTGLVYRQTGTSDGSLKRKIICSGGGALGWVGWGAGGGGRGSLGVVGDYKMKGGVSAWVEFSCQDRETQQSTAMTQNNWCTAVGLYCVSSFSTLVGSGNKRLMKIALI